MSINSVTIHDTKHPKTFHRCKLFDYKKAILVDFPHLGNESRSCLERKLLNYLMWLSVGLLLGMIIRSVDFVGKVKIVELRFD